MIGSDGLPSEGKPHPRLYGTMARALQVYVREEGLVSLEEEVRKMTSLAAGKHRLRERGLSRPARSPMSSSSTPTQSRTSRPMLNRGSIRGASLTSSSTARSPCGTPRPVRRAGRMLRRAP